LVDARTTAAVLGLQLRAIALALTAGELAGLLGEDEIHGEPSDLRGVGGTTTGGRGVPEPAGAGKQGVVWWELEGVSSRTRGPVNVRLVHEFKFEAAHRLPKVPAGHKCERLHGHSFKIELTVKGPVNPETGWFIDFGVIYDVWQPLHAQLDHNYLNEIPGLENPTSENLAKWIWDAMKPKLPSLAQVTVFETCDARCEYAGD
jgi:6-pyruvoyltetrahydropterin/6-carboxytetrahydropterin synthase